MEYKLGQPQTANRKGLMVCVSHIQLGRANQLGLILTTHSRTSTLYPANSVQLVTRISGPLYGGSKEIQFTILDGAEQYRTADVNHTALRMEVVSRLVSNDLKYLTYIKNALHELYWVHAEWLV